MGIGGGDTGIGLSQQDMRAFQREIAEVSEEQAEGVVARYAERLIERAAQTPETNARSLARLGLEGAKAFIRGLRPASSTTYARRIATCKSCPHVRVLAGSQDPSEAAIYQCRLCNCVMNAKARLVGGTCPDNRF